MNWIRHGDYMSVKELNYRLECLNLERDLLVSNIPITKDNLNYKIDILDPCFKIGHTNYYIAEIKKDNDNFDNAMVEIIKLETIKTQEKDTKNV